MPSTWTTWNVLWTDASTASTATTWGSWCSTATTTGTIYMYPAYPPSVRERAAALLAEHLSEEQAAEYAQHKYFTVISRDGQRRYQIHHGRSGNVREVNGQGHRLRTFCIHPGEAVPDEDTMLAQKLMLEADDPEFFRLANVS